MFDVQPNTTNYTKIGELTVYNSQSGMTVITTIPVGRFIKCDGTINCVKDTNGDTVIVSGFPTIIKYNEKLNPSM